MLYILKKHKTLAFALISPSDDETGWLRWNFFILFVSQYKAQDPDRGDVY